MYAEIPPPRFREWIIERTGGQTMLCVICTTISRVDHARYEVPYAQELGTCIWGPCYNSTLYATWINVICATGKNINPRIRFKIKASYIVSTESDVRRVTVLAVEATLQTLREIVGGRVVRWCWVNFQCRGVLQFGLE